MGWIYIHINKTNGKKYIGQTTMEPSIRWGKDGCKYKGQLFYNAIKKYGWNNFEHEAYEINDLLLDGMERFLIDYYHTMDRDFGYNLDGGGNKNKFQSEESRKKNSESQKGEKNHMYGKHHSEESNRKNAEAHKKFHYIIQSPNGEIFETNSLKAFCKEHNINCSHMCSDGHTKGWTVLSKESLC